MLNKEVVPSLEPGEEEAQEGLFHPFAEQGLCFLMHGQCFSGQSLSKRVKLGDCDSDLLNLSFFVLVTLVGCSLCLSLQVVQGPKCW